MDRGISSSFDNKILSLPQRMAAIVIGFYSRIEAQKSFVVSGENAGKELIEAYFRGERNFQESEITGEVKSHPLRVDPFSNIVAYGKLNSVTLSERSLNDIDLSGAILNGLYIGETSFQKSRFLGCRFSNTELTLCDFRESDLSNSIFLNCSLMEADFRGANLEGACFDNSDLTGADFAGANWQGVDFSTARVDAVHWYNHEPKPQ